jgi:hypothetical protein
MQIGYARVSTADQNPDLQEDALQKAGCEKIFHDVACGAVDSRRGGATEGRDERADVKSAFSVQAQARAPDRTANLDPAAATRPAEARSQTQHLTRTRLSPPVSCPAPP